MSYDVSLLSPEIVWKYFDRIRQIPRESGNEKRLGDAILAWSNAAGASGTRDDAGNVIVTIPATPGYESIPGIVLQCHMDMVCEKRSDVAFNFRNDSIQLKRDGDWITADGTTLGADNGIGLATALAFLEIDDISHGPLEILATVEEETGLYGALGLDASLISGRMLFNLDSEEDGIFYVGCAGGLDSSITLPVDRTAPKSNETAYNLKISGLCGGHSGLDIILNRGNGVVLMARLLQKLYAASPFLLGAIYGGDKHNAIPREAAALIVAPGDPFETWQTLLAEARECFLDEFDAVESNIDLSLSPTALPDSVFTPASTRTAIDLLLSIPNGVMAMMRDIAGVVETSNNLARVKTENSTVKILCSSRSSVSAAISGVADKLDAIARLSGATCRELSSYPGWKPDMGSKMLAHARDVWTSVTGQAPKIQVVHAGLECGIIGEKFGDMDMISLGPTIENPHSPSERVNIPSVERFFRFAKAFVASVAANG
jgi:dipeptidase D